MTEVAPIAATTDSALARGGAWTVPGWSGPRGSGPPSRAGVPAATPPGSRVEGAGGHLTAREWAIELAIRWLNAEGSVPHREAARACRRRALVLWPRLDSLRLARTRGDPWRIARLVAERSPRPLEEIVAMLTRSAPACPVRPPRSNRPVRRAKGVLRVVPAT